MYIARFSAARDHLYRSGTRIIKFFLHLSKEEQRRRFLKRIDEPEKNWKFSLAGIQERKYWKQYMGRLRAVQSTPSLSGRWTAGLTGVLEQYLEIAQSFRVALGQLLR